MLEGLKELNWQDAPTEEQIEEEHQYGILCNNRSEEFAEKLGGRHWGRWFLNISQPISLDTKVIMGNKYYPYKCHSYEITLDRCNTEAERKNWLRQMSAKNWISDKGVKDLAQAFEDLLKEGKIKP